LAIEAGVPPAEHVANMEICHINQPRDQRPQLFRVPAPVVAPGLLTPIAAENQPKRQQRKADANQLIRGLAPAEADLRQG
jgi:hypothetical protein